MAVSETKLWLAQFLFDRRLRQPTGKPLHAYRISESEFAELTEALAGKRQGFDSPVHRVHWCACFCLHVAESYRRRYDPAVGWTWQLFEPPLSLAFSPQERSEIVTAGLKYWGRPIRRHDHANDYLGSLFAEGGLPWSLISSPAHGFGRAVKSGVRNYYLDKESGYSIPARMTGFHEYFPRSFRTEEVSMLLAGIVSQLISIVEAVQIRSSESPVERLDREMPGWREGFPIPLDDGNAIRLVSEWLVEADRERKAWQRREKPDVPSSCRHRLAEGERNLERLITVVDIQREIRFPLSSGLSSTRLEMVCYEGDRPIRTVGSVYAAIDESGVRFRSPKSSVEIQRKHVGELLSLKVLDSGACVHSIPLPDSVIDAEHAPAIFEQVEARWQFLSAASCSTKSQRVLVRLPADWDLMSGEALDRSADDGATWFEADAGIQLSGAGETLAVSFAEDEPEIWRLTGSAPLATTRPELTFLGWPRLLRGVDATPVPAGQVHSINQQRRSRLEGSEFGAVRYQLCGSDNATLFRQRFGVLPIDFRVRLLPRTARDPARLLVSSSEQLLLSAAVGAAGSRDWQHCGNSAYELPTPSQPGHDDIRLSVRSRTNPTPVVLCYPYPFEGVRVTNAAGELVPGGPLVLSQLLGMEAVLFAGPTGARTFRIVLSLIGERGSVPTQYATMRVADQPVRVRLHSFSEEIAAMLGVSDNQDSIVRLSIESGVEHIAFRIGHYKYRAMPAQDGKSVLISGTEGVSHESGGSPAVMCIPEPGTPPIPLEEVSASNGSVAYQLPSSLEDDGPWLVHALPETTLGFRPLFVLGRPRDVDPLDAGSIGVAIRRFHPFSRPTLISDEVASMGADPAHPGWSYLKELKDKYSHLPLSVFEIWKSIASNPRCLALAVLRMELSIQFCQRMQIELAVIWEAVPIHFWREALAACSVWFEGLGFPDSLVQQFKTDGVSKIKTLWPCFEHLGTYLEGGPLPPSPPLQLVLPGWHQALRAQHAEDERWPIQCGPELRAWAMSRDLPIEFKGLEGLNYMHAVTYLPIFLAYVTTGQAKLELAGVSLPYLKHAVRHVSVFDHAQWFSPVHGLVTCHLARTLQN